MRPGQPLPFVSLISLLLVLEFLVVHTVQWINTYSLVCCLSVEIDSYGREGLSVEVSPEFTRRTTVIRLRGGGEEGIGEDPTYSAEDQEAFQAEGTGVPLYGSQHTDAR